MLRCARIAHFGHARAAHRSEAGIHDAVLVGLDNDVNVLAVLLTMLYIDGAYQAAGFGRLLFAEIDAELVLVGRGAALFVDRPSVSLVAAANDAIVAGDVEFLGVLRDDRKPVDVTFVSHWCLPHKNVGQPAVQKLVETLGIDVAIGVDAQGVLREVLRGVSPDLLAAVFAVETRIMTRAIQRPVALVVSKRESLMRADGGETDDIAIRARAGRHAHAELDQNTWSVGIRICDIEWLIDFEIMHVAEPIGGIIDPRRGWRGLRVRRYHHRSGGACCRNARAGQKFPAAGIYKLIAARCHAFLPDWRSLKTPAS